MAKKGTKKSMPVKGTSPKVGNKGSFGKTRGVKYGQGEQGRVKPADANKTVRRRRNP